MNELKQKSMNREIGKKIPELHVKLKSRGKEKYNGFCVLFSYNTRAQRIQQNRIESCIRLVGH